MKLTNPTDQELDAAFAVHVAGWNPVCHCGDRMDMHRHDEHAPVQMDEPIPNFTRSFDAVLPWLEKQGWKGTSNRHGATCVATVTVLGGKEGWDGTEHTATQDYTHTQSPLPRAAIIALLRANGHEVEFTR